MNKNKTKKSKKKDPRIEEEFYEEIEVTCPNTGKKIKQKVKVTRYKAVGPKPVGNKGISEELNEEIDYAFGTEESED